MTRYSTLISSQRDQGFGVRKLALAPELNPREPTTAMLKAEHEETWAALQTGEGAKELSARKGRLFEAAQRAHSEYQSRLAREDMHASLRAEHPDFDARRAAMLAAERSKGDVDFLDDENLQREINSRYDLAAVTKIAATIGVQADERLAFELRYAVSWFVGYHPPEGLRRIKWRLVRRHVEDVRDNPTHIHRLWPHRGRRDLTVDEQCARERAHSLILDASHPMPEGHGGLWHCPSIISSEVARNLYTWPPPDGETLTAQACAEITAAATQVLVELPRFARMTGGQSPDDFGFPCLVDELAAIFEALTGKRPTASVSTNQADAQRCAPFVLFVAAVLAPIRDLSPEYLAYASADDLYNKKQNVNRTALAQAIARALRKRPRSTPMILSTVSRATVGHGAPHGRHDGGPCPQSPRAPTARGARSRRASPP